jgi:hypothetical protein
MQMPGSEGVAKRPRISSKPAAAEKVAKPRRTKAALTEHIAEPVMTLDVQIAEAAYYLAAKRNFDPGHELDDWLQAEQMLRRVD